MPRPGGGFSDENVGEKAQGGNMVIDKGKSEYCREQKFRNCQNQKSWNGIVNEKSGCYNLYQYMIQNLTQKRGKI